MSSSDHSPSLSALSGELGTIVARIAPGVVAVGRRGHQVASGFAWRPGLIVTAEEAIEEGDDLDVLRPDGTRAPATLAGRDPSTAIALLRVDGPHLPALPLAEAERLAAGNIVLAVARRAEGASARLGIVETAGAAWRSMRGGTIDRLLRLDLVVSRRSQGAPVVDAAGNPFGMLVAGPRHAALAIPAATIERVADQLQRQGRIARGYLGLGMQPVGIDPAVVRALSLPSSRGVMVVGVDASGPGAAAGIMQGDVIAAIGGEHVGSVRGIVRRLGPETVGKTLPVALIRAGAARTIDVTIGERPRA